MSRALSQGFTAGQHEYVCWALLTFPFPFEVAGEHPVTTCNLKDLWFPGSTLNECSLCARCVVFYISGLYARAGFI